MDNRLDNTVFIYLDDVRVPPSKNWVVMRSAIEAYETILHYHKEGSDMVLSLDHDLGDDLPTGYDLLSWLEKDIATDKTFRPSIAYLVHSANPVGRDNMARAIAAILRMLR